MRDLALSSWNSYVLNFYYLVVSLRMIRLNKAPSTPPGLTLTTSPITTDITVAIGV